MNNTLFRGWVRHTRTKPARHSFSYRISALLLDIRQISKIQKQIWFFSYNRFNLFSFYDKDHGPRDGSPLKPWVDHLLMQHGVNIKKGKVYLFSMPRIFGYVFNPLSMYFCYDQDEELKAIIYEVKNTFGEQHCYVIPIDISNALEKVIFHDDKKVFFVSPFISMDAQYSFRVSMCDDFFSILIKVLSASGDSMVATLRVKPKKLNNLALLKVFFTDPVMTFKVIIGIHYEALRLLIKRVPFYKHTPISDLVGK
ncbi:MAG: hypothetical protein CMM30_07135 [Rhodospirillaceae bacterium]|nr:hypothetical protein [Rhodospirillaceae bacterium]